MPTSSRSAWLTYTSAIKCRKVHKTKKPPLCKGRGTTEGGGGIVMDYKHNKENKVIGCQIKL